MKSVKFYLIFPSPFTFKSDTFKSAVKNTLDFIS